MTWTPDLEKCARGTRADKSTSRADSRISGPRRLRDVEPATGSPWLGGRARSFLQTGAHGLKLFFTHPVIAARRSIANSEVDKRQQKTSPAAGEAQSQLVTSSHRRQLEPCHRASRG